MTTTLIVILLIVAFFSLVVGLAVRDTLSGAAFMGISVAVLMYVHAVHSWL